VDCYWLDNGHAIYGGYRDISAANPRSQVRQKVMHVQARDHYVEFAPTLDSAPRQYHLELTVLRASGRVAREADDFCGRIHTNHESGVADGLD
jgi:hypothetical protein